MGDNLSSEPDRRNIELIVDFLEDAREPLTPALAVRLLRVMGAGEASRHP